MKVVEVDLLVKTAPDKVIRAFTDPVMLRGWWGVERALVETKKGGLYILGWDITEQGFKYLSTGIVKLYDSERILVIDNYTYCTSDRQFLGPMALTVIAENHSPGITAMHIGQSGYREGGDWDWYYHAVVDAWPVVAKTLKEYLETGSV